MSRRVLALANLLSARFSRVKPTKEQVTEHLVSRLHDILGLSPEESSRAAAVIHSAHLSNQQTVDRAVHLVANNFTRDDIVHNPQIFLVHPKTLIRRLQVLRELSVEKPPIAVSESLFNYFLDQKIEVIKELKLCPADAQVARRLLQAVPEARIRSAILAEVWSESLSLRQVHCIARVRYLQLKLEISEPCAQAMVTKKRVSMSSLSSLVVNTSFLRDECRLPLTRLLANPSLLGLDCDNARTILRERPLLAGRPTLDLVAKYPKLLDTAFVTLARNLNLVESKFSDQQLLSAPLVLTLSHAELESRIGLLETEAELAPFAAHRRALRLVLQMKSARQRLERLRASGRTRVTLDQLVGAKKYFERSLLGLQNKSSLEEFARNEMGLVLSAEARQVVGRHPMEVRFDQDNARRVLHILDGLGLTSEHKWRALPILLYDALIVRRALEKLHSWPRDSVGQMAVYSIEKEFGFSGRGVYCSRG